MTALRTTFAGTLWRIEDGLGISESLRFRQAIVEAGPLCGSILALVQTWEREGWMVAIWNRWLANRGRWSIDYSTQEVEAYRAAWIQHLRERVDLHRRLAG